MGLNDTPSGERTHIGFFGRRNAGKSSVVNAITNQAMAIVSSTKGTTTDPVKKAMELLPLGPVVIIDTPGIDDSGSLGELRVRRTREVLGRTDIAILVVDAVEGMQTADRELLQLIQDKHIPYLVVYNKCDLLDTVPGDTPQTCYVSAVRGTGIRQLKEKMAALKPQETEYPLVRDLLKPGDTVLLVIPIDKAAPKGRLILPQQQAIRDILDGDAAALVVKETGLPDMLARLPQPPALVITDSQVFGKVAAVVPETIRLTSFSILMARHKGVLDRAVQGVTAINKLKDGDKVLIAEGCTHHRQCNDIGTCKIPRWLTEYTGKHVYIETSSGNSFPEDLSNYTLVIHCGGCMLNEREMVRRMQQAAAQHIAITNYGIFIAYVHGILKRTLTPFPALQQLLS